MYNNDAVTQQPRYDSSVIAQQPASGVPPPGLEYLTQVDQLMVKQKVELLEAFLSCETQNKYEIKNTMGQKVYSAKEDTACCNRLCCGNCRPFDMRVMDNEKREVMHFSRPLRFMNSFCCCCRQNLTVEAPKGSIIGYVRQQWSCCYPSYNVNNAHDDTVLNIQGPCLSCDICSCCKDIEFEVSRPGNDSTVGKISKQWSGLLKEAFTDADNFGVTFPMDLDVKEKATMLGAVILIDFIHFEKDPQKDD